MNTICLVPDSTTNFAITALKNAYDKCNDKAARDAILSAFNALNLLHYDLDMKMDLTRTAALMQLSIAQQCSEKITDWRLVWDAQNARLKLV